MQLSETELSKFWSYVEKTNTCWNWKGGKSRGYGEFWFRGKNVKAHRLSYIIKHGSIDSTLQIDHLCKNKICVNPSHIELVTAKVNTLRSDNRTAKQARQTHCIRGHPLSGDNLVFRMPQRGCRECWKIDAKIKYRQKVENTNVR